MLNPSRLIMLIVYTYNASLLNWFTVSVNFPGLKAQELVGSVCWNKRWNYQIYMG